MSRRRTVVARRRAWLTTVPLVLGVVAGCGSGEAPATWVLDDDRLRPSTTKFTALVTRVGCNDGVTGEVQPPTITTTDRAVTVIFSVTPGRPRSASCPGNEIVRYRVRLPEELGRRTLVDGGCQTDEGADLIECGNDGVRLEP